MTNDLVSATGNCAYIHQPLKVKYYVFANQIVLFHAFDMEYSFENVTCIQGKTNCVSTNLSIHLTIPPPPPPPPPPPYVAIG